MPVVENEIELQAPPWRVWTTLTKLESYDRWHPFIRSGGEPALGAEVEYIFRNRAFRKPFTAAATIIRFDEPTAFGWRIGPSSLLSFEETFEILPSEQGSVLTHSMARNGLFARLPARFFDKRLHDMIVKADEALERYLRGAANTPARPGNRRKRRIAQSRGRHSPSNRGSVG